MLKSTLLELLGSFSPKELKEFGDYIRSPFFNKNETLIKLYDFIRKSINDPKKLEKEYVFSKIFKGEEYNDSVMRSHMFNLAKLAEDYLAYINYTSEKKNVLHLVNELNKRNLGRSFEKKLKAALDEIEKTEFKDSAFFFRKYTLVGERDSYNYKNARLLNIKDKPDETILEQSENLIIYFLINIMQRYRYLLNRKYTVSVDFNLKALEEMISHLHDNSYGNIPLLTFYYNTLNMLLYEREEDFYKLRGYLQKYSDYLAEGEIYNTCVILQNYCIKKFHSGNTGFLKEMFINEKFMLGKGIYKMESSDYISPMHYKNNVMTALLLKEYEWAESFIVEYKKHLAPEQEENAFNYCYARLNFEKGNYRKALDQLSLVQNEDVYYKMEIKQFLLKIYYELNMYQEIMDVSDTFRHFLANNKLLTKMHVETNSNFLRLLNKLIKLKDTGGDKIEAGFLKEEILKTENLVGRAWLAEKAEELEKGILLPERG